MMKLKCAFFVILLCYGSVFAGEVRQIELNDGSVIFGEIVSFNEGVYTVNSGSFGTLEIEDTKIRAIISNEVTSNETITEQLPDFSNSVLGTELQSLQSKIMNDKNIMGTIMSLQNDPDFQAILQDTDTIGAVMSGDFKTLLNNPKFKKLLDHQAVKDIAKEVEEKEEIETE
ncbi:hypothetical protein [Candidatus Parabeggiatoa sp. HSG14]|uniref:hypothetical protein n=1 Tax=Candidatus Parabeggiatoa sp. HSG14 TaxID=3055593 RepID=UPI0025A7214D|nr:hypothetical protein [Thiotrichales bacterium HSG14]